MTGAEIEFHTHRILVVGVGVPQRGGELSRLPVRDSGIVQPSGQPARGIPTTALDVIHGAVLHHVPEVLLLVGVAPLDPLPGRQGYGGIGHGAHHVDEGHAQDRAPEQFRGLVDRRADQEPPGGPPLAREHVGRCPPLRQVPRHVHEVVERVLLAQVLPAVRLLVPVPSHLAPAPDVRDHVYHPPVEEG